MTDTRTPPTTTAYPPPPPYDDEPPPDLYDGHNGYEAFPSSTPQPAGDPLVDPAAERAVLGAMLADPRALDPTTSIVTGADFHTVAHEHLFDAAVALYSRGRPVDPITVANQLGPTELKKTGGQSYLHQLALDAAHVLDAGYYAQIVADKAARRRLRTHHQRGLQRLEQPDTSITADDLRQAALTDLESLPVGVPGVDTTPTGHPWSPVDWDDIFDNGDDDQQPTQLTRVDGNALLYPAAVHSISGEPESGKTWVALIAIKQALDAGDHVLYLDFEDRASRVGARLRTLGLHRDAIRDRFHYIRPAAALDMAGRRIIDALAGGTPDRPGSVLAIIDGVTEAMTLHGLSLMDNEDAARYLDLLPRHLADHGCAVLQIDHVVKDAEKQGRWAIGAGHKLAGLDGAAYGIKVVEPFGKGKLGRAKITVSKDRPGAVREYALGPSVAQLVIDSRPDNAAHGQTIAWLEPPLEGLVTDDGDMRPTHLMEKVSRYLEVNPNGCTGKQVEDAVRGKREYVRIALRKLLDEDFTVVTPGPRGASIHTSVVAFRETDDATR